MATGQINRVFQHLQRSLLDRDGESRTDGQLLEGFIRRREEAAIQTLIVRHGPMVLAVCRRILRNHHDAEDAFQATFLVLVRKATSIIPKEMVANWLYGVACNTALKARALAAQKHSRERQVTQMPEPEAAETRATLDLQALLDEELRLLPDKYRSPIVLCDLEGKTRKEAADQLGWPEGTVAGRLARARAMLAKRLTRHGLVLTGATLPGVLAENLALASLPAALTISTTKAACLFATGQAIASGVISLKVAALTEGVLKAMLVTKLKIATAIGLVLGLVAYQGGALSFYSAAAEQNKSVPDAPRPVPAPADAGPNPPQIADEKLQNAEKDFNVAEFYDRTGKHASASFYYELVRQRYPNTKFADLAKDRLAMLSKALLVPAQDQVTFNTVLKLRNQSVSDVTNRLREILAGEGTKFRAIAEPVTNTLMVTANTPEQLKIIEVIVNHLDQRLPENRRLIAAAISAQADHAKLQGEWFVTKAEENGEKIKAKGMGKFTFADDMVLVSASALQSYEIAPPDILSINVSVIPPDTTKPPTALPNQAINGVYLVRPDGTVSLGVWGNVTMYGRSLQEAKEAVRQQVFKTMPNDPNIPKTIDSTPEKLLVTVDLEACNNDTRGSFNLDPTTNPKQMRFTFKSESKRETYYGIYRFDGDDLTVCIVNTKEGALPTEFTTKKGSHRRMLQLSRRKKAVSFGGSFPGSIGSRLEPNQITPPPSVPKQPEMVADNSGPQSLVAVGKWYRFMLNGERNSESLMVIEKRSNWVKFRSQDDKGPARELWLNLQQVTMIEPVKPNPIEPPAAPVMKQVEEVVADSGAQSLVTVGKCYKFKVSGENAFEKATVIERRSNWVKFRAQDDRGTARELWLNLQHVSMIEEVETNR